MPQTNLFIRAFRLAHIFLRVCIGLVIAGGAWAFISNQSKLSLTKWWCGGLLKCFNIRLTTYGNLPDAQTNGVMFVANHISWLDIHAINSVIPLQFIAKSEVSNWPIFGYLVRKSGTLFIDRTRRKDAARIVPIATQRLQNGDNVGFFPEGTTTVGTSLLPFKSSIVQAAIDAETKIWPIAIRYPLPNGGANTQVAYAGDTTMGESIFNVLKQKNPSVELHFLTPISTHGASRQTLTQTAFMAIAKQLNLAQF